MAVIAEWSRPELEAAEQNVDWELLNGETEKENL